MMPRMGDTSTATLFGQGLELLLYGMGTVVLFLTLLVFATQRMSALIQRFFPEPESHAAAPRGTQSSPDAQPSPEVLAVITAALHQHRNRRPPEQ